MAVAAGLDDRRVAAENIVQRGGGAGVELRVGRQEHQVGTAFLGLAHRHAAGNAGGLRFGGEGQHGGAVGAGRRHHERPPAEGGRHERLHGGAEGGGVDEEDGDGSQAPLPPSSSPEFLPDRVEAPGEGRGVVLAGGLALSVAAVVARGEVGKLAGQVRKEVAPRRGAESERLPGRATGTSFLRRAEERGQLLPAVGDAGNDGGREEADVEPGGGQATEGAEPRVRGGGAGLDAPDEPSFEGGERDVNLQRVPLGELDQEVGVAGDERRLGDDAEVEPAVREQRLEQPAGDPETAFGRLVGIGGGADDDGRAVDARGIEGAAENAGRVDLDEDAVFEGIALSPQSRPSVLSMVHRCVSLA